MVFESPQSPVYMSESSNIDVAIVWDQNKKFGPTPSPMYVGDCGDSKTIWELSSADPDGDGKSGIPMVDGPFKGFNANFNLSPSKQDPLIREADQCEKPVPMQAADTNVSKGAGCSLSATPVNPLERGDWWLLLGFIAWMGGLVAKRKRAS